MTVVEHSSDNEPLLLTAMALCSDAELNTEKTKAIGEPTECALVNDALARGFVKTELKKEYVRI